LRSGTDRKNQYGPRMNDEGIIPFRIDIPERDLADLAARLDRTRWPAEMPGAGRSLRRHAGTRSSSPRRA
jgi:hypothetical protein